MIYRLILIASLAYSCQVLSAFAEAPVVDDSENFALLEEQQAESQPVAHGQSELVYQDEQPALAHDDAPAALAKEDASHSDNDPSLINKIQGLQQDIQELRGQLEVQAHQLKLLQEQQLAFYKDLDARLSQGNHQAALNKPTTPLTIDEEKPKMQSVTANPPIEAVTETPTVTPTVLPATASAAARTNPADEQISYLAAYDLVKTKQYDEARMAMESFLAKYPQGGYSANAQYWLGELYLVKKDYSAAMTHFDVVLKQFPSSSKCSASLLKIGYALAATGQTQAAKSRLQEVMKKYPDTNTAQLASAKLATLGG